MIFHNSVLSLPPPDEPFCANISNVSLSPYTFGVELRSPTRNEYCLPGSSLREKRPHDYADGERQARRLRFCRHYMTSSSRSRAMRLFFRIVKYNGTSSTFPRVAASYPSLIKPTRRASSCQQQHNEVACLRVLDSAASLDHTLGKCT